MLSTAYVPTAEAAYIAGVTDRQLQRLFDEEVLAPPFVRSDNGRLNGQSGGRMFARISAAFAKFYFDLDEDLTASARRFVIGQMSQRILARPDANALLALSFQPKAMNWDVGFKNFDIGLGAFVAHAQARAAQIERVNQLIVEDPEILGSQPVLKGTRLPVETLLAMQQGGRGFPDLQSDYPSLTQELLDAAAIYQAIHPRRGRPAKPAQAPVGWTLRSRKIIRAAHAPA
jgi:uncharacterized protein (DUF433 family)